MGQSNFTELASKPKSCKKKNPEIKKIRYRYTVADFHHESSICPFTVVNIHNKQKLFFIKISAILS